MTWKEKKISSGREKIYVLYVTIRFFLIFFFLFIFFFFSSLGFYILVIDQKLQRMVNDACNRRGSFR